VQNFTEANQSQSENVPDVHPQLIWHATAIIIIIIIIIKNVYYYGRAITKLYAIIN